MRRLVIENLQKNALYNYIGRFFVFNKNILLVYLYNLHLEKYIKTALNYICNSSLFKTYLNSS